MKYIKTKQGTQEWLDMRKGILTASKLNDCFTGKLAISKAGCDRVAKGLAMDVLGMPVAGFTTEYTERGHQLENEAIKLLKYKIKGGYKFNNDVGFYKDEENGLGCSPDGLISKFIDNKEKVLAGIEIKCPMGKAQLEYYLEPGIPAVYYPQVQFSMYVTKIPKWHFVSYMPGQRLKMCTAAKDAEFYKKISEVVDLVHERKKIYITEIQGVNNELG